jgi:nucleoside-diphosphate-sugar epimerase
MKGRVLVTGATGHLGANLVRRLLNDGESVRVLLQPGASTAAVEGLDVERVQGDLRDGDAIARAVQGTNRVFHTAAIVSTVQGDVAHRRSIFEVNVLGTRNILDAALKSGVERVVVTGSFSAVGYDPDDPSKPSNEEMRFDPFRSPTPYSTSKAAAEHECWQAAARGLDVVVAVSCAILGPNDFLPSRMGGVLCEFAAGKLRAYIDGGFPWVAARDIAAGHALSMSRGKTGERYILATEYRTMDEILSLFERVTGKPRPRIKMPPRAMSAVAKLTEPFVTRFLPPERHRLTPAAVHILRLHRHADTSKAQRELGFVPTSIESAVREAYEQFIERGKIVPSTSSTRASREAPVTAVTP